MPRRSGYTLAFRLVAASGETVSTLTTRVLAPAGTTGDAIVAFAEETIRKSVKLDLSRGRSFSPYASRELRKGFTLVLDPEAGAETRDFIRDLAIELRRLLADIPR